LIDACAAANCGAQAAEAKQKQSRSGEERSMLDIIFIAATVLFFAVGVFYVRGCERLKQE